MTRKKKKKNKNENGYRFEIWGEHFLRKLGCHYVKRNVIYYVESRLTGRTAKRQVDIQYLRFLDMSKFNLASLVIVECKYRPSSVDDVVYLEEKRRIVGADHAELLLARRPSYAVQEKADEYKIRVYQPNELAKYHPFPGKTLCQQVRDIRRSRYKKKATPVHTKRWW